MKDIGTETPMICTHVFSADSRCQDCDEREMIARWFDTFTPVPGREPGRNSGKLFTPFPKVHQHRGHAEKIGRYGSPRARKYEKRRANRLRRRAEKVDPTNAPTRLIRGWND